MFKCSTQLAGTGYEHNMNIINKQSKYEHNRMYSCGAMAILKCRVLEVSCRGLLLIYNEAKIKNIRVCLLMMLYQMG